MGVYPEVGLKEARAQRDQARKTLAGGIDPGAQRKAAKISASGADSFETIAREWHAKFAPGWTALYALRTLERLELDIFPWIGKRPIADIKAPELLAVLRRIEERGVLETPTAPSKNAGRYSVMPWQRAAQNATPARAA